MSAAPGPASDPGRDNVIGAVLIVAAVLIGVLLLAKGYGNEGGIVSTESAAATSTTTVPEATTTTVPAVRPPAQVPVMVANASGKSGAATTLANKLKAGGYTTVDTSNGSPVTTTIVYFNPGWEAEAKAVATVVGSDPAAVRAMPPTPPVDVKGANVLVMLGPDRA